MSNLVITSSTPIALPAPLPPPRVENSIRTGTMEDLAFIDGLQKAHTKQVGWMPMQQLEQKIRRGHVLVAEEISTTDSADTTDEKWGSTSSALSALSAVNSPVGYCIGTDQYFKRDDVGIIYQLNVAPGSRRSLIGAALVKAMFERAAYGCRLFCCWCAQDIEANYFWEAMGFVPLAFRAGARARGQKSEVRGQPARVHIFWQKRIRVDDRSTRWWFPCQTSGGSIREDRLVLPIPPGMHWSDPMPRVLPADAELPLRPGSAQAVVPSTALGTGSGPFDTTQGRQLPVTERKKKPSTPKRVVQESRYKLTGFKLLTKGELEERERAKRSKPPRKAPVMKNDPALVARARELRDRWLEQVDREPELLMGRGKYEVGRLAA